MADNITLPGSGAIVAAENVGGVDYQRVKVVDGAPGGTAGVPISTGPVDFYDPGLNVRTIPSRLPQTVSAGDERPISIDVVPPGWDREPSPDDSGYGNDSLIGQAFDCASGIRMSVGPAQAQAGQQPLSMALPVALANEQFFDKWIAGAPCGPGGLNGNLLCPYPFTSPLNTALDVLQYRSASFDIVTGVGVSGGVVTFEASNNGTSWIAVAMTDMAASTMLPVTTVTLAASTTRSFAGPILHRFFRLRPSTAIAGGQVVAFGRLCTAPFAIDAPVVNVAQLAATNVVTGGVAGTMAVGGNIAPGIAQTTYPLVVGGVDFGALTRRIVSDVLGQLIVTGPDFRNSMNEGVNKAPVVVRELLTDNGTEQGAELLNKVLSELRRISMILKETPYHLNAGVQMTDEVVDFCDDKTMLT
jgi:hypothetical protein